MARQNYFAYSLADFFVCLGYYQAYMWRRQTRDVCSLWLLSFAEEHLILIKLRQREQGCGGNFPSQTAFWFFRFLGHKHLSVCLNTSHFNEIIVHPQFGFSHSSWHDCYANHIWKVFSFTAGKRCLGVRWVTIKGWLHLMVATKLV